MNVIDVIDTINETYKYVYDNYGFGCYNDDAKKTFTSGFCYEYFILLKRFFPGATLMMKNDKNHCAAKIEDEVYDATGLIDDASDFHEATGCDVEYIYRNYGWLDIGFRDLLNKLVVKNVFNKGNSFTKKRNKSV